jgi:hypothetical protein
MTTLRDAAQQALAYMDSVGEQDMYPEEWAVAKALRAALAQPTVDPTDPGHDVDVLREQVRHLERRVRELHALAQQTQTPCDIAEDGVCEVIDCCRNRSQILEALEIGYAAAQAEAAQYHAAMAGYRPERHAEMDADVQKIAKAISAVKAVTAQREQEPTARYKCTVVDDRHPNGVPFEQWVNAPQQEPVKQMRGNALARWAHEQEEPPDTDWQRGYEAARRWVRQVGLPSLAQPLPDPVDEYRKGFIDGQIDMRDRPEEQEPVAWMVYTEDGKSAYVTDNPHDLVGAYKAFALYTHPPRREWQSLTTQDIALLDWESWKTVTDWVHAIETHLREKNNG